MTAACYVLLLRNIERAGEGISALSRSSACKESAHFLLDSTNRPFG